MVEKLKMIWQDAKQLKDERGLTLVELLVVVVILGIIAAIAVVAIGGIIENSRKDAMVSDARQMISASKLYVASNSVSDGDILRFNGTVADSIDASSFIDSMNDPYGEKYTTGAVKINITGNDYSYSVFLLGDKTIGTVNSYEAEEDLSKESVDEVN